MLGHCALLYSDLARISQPALVPVMGVRKPPCWRQCGVSPRNLQTNSNAGPWT